jgi:hypothetical protein
MRELRVNVNGTFVYVPVPAELMAYFKQQFVRSSPTDAQKQKYATIMNLLAAAYLCGKEVGRRQM